MFRSQVGRRYLSYQNQLRNAVENVNTLLEKNDRLSYLLAQYIPEPARNTFLAIHAFGLEVNKISAKSAGASLGGIPATDLKFKFWSDLLTKAFLDSGNVGEPIAFLLRDGLRNGENLDISYFQQFLQTRKHFLQQNQFGSVADICSYGEGTYSQLNYATQALLLSPHISPSVIHLLEESPALQGKVSEVAAHIGQSTAITSMILGLNYYASSKNFVTLPVDLMSKFELSQESVLRLSQGHLKEEEVSETREKLRNVIYETAITANDHLLTARSKLQEIKSEISSVVEENAADELLARGKKNWRHGIPDVVFTPLTVAIPTSLYLQRLEKNDFDVFSKKLQQKEWRLAWTSFRSYYLRTI
ncbi:hypothetical protein PUMCH_004816 [Australozyma saopauloensis]|uniref:NADH dehydrogenase (Ubiquinone) complex I, assembly factor 6 n=1 Tax=Australozyma saopauloensis TaxID=291208 RepID=A0AAX4HG22_9ASCO|nr:hypothetical protein PUMCH_004816 [[Candida] saopauloensis]